MRHITNSPISSPASTGKLALEQSDTRLPFWVHAAHPAQLSAIQALRAQAYGRHLPGQDQRMAAAEVVDLSPGVCVLVATDKRDGGLLGTLRIHTNFHQPLPVQAAVGLPARLGARLAEATRLVVLPGRHSTLVKRALCKAFYLFCQTSRINTLVIAARPTLRKQYRAMGFTPALDPDRPVFLSCFPDIPHQVLALSVAEAPRLWADHPWSHFMTGIEHIDILLEPFDAAAVSDHVRTKPSFYGAGVTG